jgi:hypothetical protein
MEKPSAEEIRALLALEPELQRLAEGLRASFGARLVGLRAGGRDIGWSKYRDSVKNAIAWEGSADWYAKAKAEWKDIKSEAIKAGEAARRRPTSRQSKLVR